MKTFTKILAATALLATTSTAALAQGNSGAALDAAGSVSVDAGGASIDAGGSANANAVNSNAGGNGNGALNAATHSNAGGNASADADGQMNYGQIISDLRTSTTAAGDIEALGEESIYVEVVTLSELQGNAGENASALEQAVSTESTLVTELKVDGAAGTYPELQGEIDAAIQAEFGAESEYSMEDVIAITSSADGQVTVIIDDTAE